MKKKVYLNTIISSVGQIILLALGIIVPRIMIGNYGSDVNGLISTITQIFTYMALLEAGIGQAARNALYKPLANHDDDGVSYIVSLAQRYYRKITTIYFAGVIILSTLLPFIIKTQIDKRTVFFAVLFEGLSGVITFFFIQTPSNLLIVDGKGYINNIVTVVNKTISYIVKIVMAMMGINIVVLQISYFVITVCKVFYYEYYFKKNYSWINLKKNTGNDKLADRNSYIITEIAWTIFSSTDMIVLSIFVSTQASSVYSVYNMVFTSIATLFSTVFMSISFVLGQKYHEDIEKYKQLHDAFNSIFIGGMTIIMSVTYILIIPFVELYTHGISDVDYINASFPIMFCLIQLLSWSRYVTGNLTGLAGYAKQTSWISLIEALTNVGLSVILVNFYGIIGVLIATVVALPLKVIYCTWLSEIKILKRNPIKALSILGINYLLFATVVFGSSKLKPIEIPNFGMFFVWGMILFVAFAIVGIMLNYIVNPDLLKVVKIIKKSRGK